MIKCEHELTDNESIAWAKRNRRDTKCSFQSLYKIDGKCYCTRHAGMIALDKLIDRKEVQRLFR